MQRNKYRASLATALGNTLEWFDFAVYGYFASTLGKIFFSSNDPGLQTVASFAVFAIGYLARPFGSLVLGPIGDILGRKKMLTFSIILMGLASFTVGLLPTYAQVGALAAYALLMLRLIQGFSVGGEFTGSMIYANESAPAQRCGLMSSISHAGALLGFTLGSFSAALIASSLGEAEIEEWGWRLPFLLGAIVAAVGWWLRKHMHETIDVNPSRHFFAKEFLSLMSAQLMLVFRGWRTLVIIAALVTFSNVLFYVVFVYFVDYASHQQQGSMKDANTITTIIQTLGIFVIILGGWLADKIGPVKITKYATIAGLILVIPCILMAQQGGLTGLAICQIFILFPVMISFGAQGVLISQLVLPQERCTMFSIGYSLALAVFAGTSPMLVSWMLDIQGWQWAPALYCFILGLPAYWALRHIKTQRCEPSHKGAFAVFLHEQK